MKLIEYRICMPLTIEENLIGQLWSFAENSRLNTSGGEGVTVQKNEFFDVPYVEDGRIHFEKLPEFESLDLSVQNAQNKSSKYSLIKKSASKDSFDKTKHVQHIAERSKSLDAFDDVSSSDVQLSANNNNELDTHKIAPIVENNNNNNQTQDKNNNNNKQGQYTHKLYHIASKFPWYVRSLLPKDSTIVHEKSWNMYPVVKTILYNEYFKKKGRIELDTVTRVCVNGQFEENVHHLTKEQLEKREIVEIDIAEALLPSEYKKEEDPTIFKSEKSGRGPLVPSEWIKNPKTPLICCYKLVLVEFKVYGLQTKVENYLKNMYKSIFAIFHRQIFCWMDKWYGLKIEDVRQIEEKLAKDLEKQIKEGQIAESRLPKCD